MKIIIISIWRQITDDSAIYVILYGTKVPCSDNTKVIGNKSVYIDLSCTFVIGIPVKCSVININANNLCPVAGWNDTCQYAIHLRISRWFYIVQVII